MNLIARQRDESFLGRYGGIIGLEWFFPKLLETIEVVPEIAEAASVWLEGGDVARQVSDQMRWLRRHSPWRNRLVLYHDIARREIRRIRHGV